MSTPSIRFKLSFPEPQTHYTEVIMFMDNIDNKEFVDIVMPVWAPGSYLVREYSKNIERLHAFSKENEAIKTEKVSKNTWRIYNHKEDIRIHYAVYAFETSVRTSFIDNSRAFLSPVGVFMYLNDHLDLSSTIEIDLPHHWNKISTGLPQMQNSNTYFAENFDILYDSPFELGNQDTWQFDVDGVLHECAMVGIADYDKEQLSTDITKIVQEENKIWGSNPNNYYLIVTHNHQQAHGGLEHLNSTILTASRFAYSQTQAYKNYLSLVAHEYFHLWNVKRLRPKALGPFNYNEENYTTALWIMEGITSYYDNLIIRRCGFYDEKEYLSQLVNEFNIVYNRPGHMYQSAARSSYDTWIKHYRPDENSHNVTISYYNKGAMHSMALDLKIIAETNGKYRLDDVLKKAYETFYLIENKGFEEYEFHQLAEDVTGVDLSEIFSAAHSVIEVDYNKYFNRVGYELIDLNATETIPSLGFKSHYQDGKTIVKTIDRDSGAWIGGLNVHDEIIAINNHRLEENSKALDYFLSKSAIDDTLSFLIARDAIIYTLEIPVMASNKKNFVIQRKENASLQEQELGDIWLSL